VQTDELTVFGPPHVELESDSQIEASSKGGQRILGRSLKHPAVSDDSGAGRRFHSRDRRSRNDGEDRKEWVSLHGGILVSLTRKVYHLARYQRSHR